jgi:molybdopterin converting factor subunit 1
MAAGDQEPGASRQITVTVRFFAAPREALGVSDLTLALPEGATVADLIARLLADYPVLTVYARFMNVAVNRAYTGVQTRLRHGDEVACLPPVGGG